MTLDSVQTLQTQLRHLERQGQQANPDGPSLMQQFLAAQQHFQTQILPLAAETTVAVQTIQPILTEMNRTFRLLGMDVAFMQTARNASTTQQRQQHMNTKIRQLLGFAEALAKALLEATGSDLG